MISFLVLLIFDGIFLDYIIIKTITEIAKNISNAIAEFIRSYNKRK